MKPVRNKIIVSVNMSQKNNFEFVTDGGLQLWGNKDFGFDGKKTQPVLTTIISTGDKPLGLLPQDVVICHHNTFRREVGKGYMHGDTGVKTPKGEAVFAIEPHQIQCRVDPSTGDPLPLQGFVLVERIPIEYRSSIIVTPDHDQYIPNQFKVVAAGGGVDEYADVVINPGDIIITYEKSDYDIEYVYDMKMKSAVRVKYADVLAISKQVYI